ncbi:MAG TPA: HEAT repeat domain-containing protein [Blastocatellia bacterium]|nr:HEAT repeat domain-containing protein [Blastocatellia bacterium]
MAENNAGTSIDAQQPRISRAKTTLPLLIVVALFIGVAYWTWHITWFGRALSDQEISEYLKETNKPNHVQHALSSLESRIEANDPSVKQWYPQIIAQADSPQPEIRLMAAWVMGQDNQSEDFHRTLLKLLNDPYPQVRRNAALGLVRFKDASGRLEIVSMLRPYDVQSPASGVLSTPLQNEQPVGIGVTLASIRQDNGQSVDVHSPVQGDVRSIVKEGSNVTAGQTIVVIGPDQTAVNDALVALALIGEPEDLPYITPYIGGQQGMPSSVKQQAARAAEAIKSRQNSTQLN